MSIHTVQILSQDLGVWQNMVGHLQGNFYWTNYRHVGLKCQLKQVTKLGVSCHPPVRGFRSCLVLAAHHVIMTISSCVCFQCSVTCGQGKTTRQVLCVNFSDQEVNAIECDPDDRPTTDQDCAMSQCPSRSSESRPFPSSPNASARNNLPRSQSQQWRTGPWGAVRHLIHSSITSQWSTNHFSGA